jgi:hypothetical protein
MSLETIQRSYDELTEIPLGPEAEELARMTDAFLDRHGADIVASIDQSDTFGIGEELKAKWAAFKREWAAMDNIHPHDLDANGRA